MGLDMYLHKRTYVAAKYDHRNVNGIVELTEGKDNKPIHVQLRRISEIIEEVGYWRKANHIHHWFVTNVQGGEDDCRDYYVSKKDFEKLLEDCKQVITNKDKAPEIMPTQVGFFFGGTDYDEYYFSEIEDTIKIVETAISEGGDYYYHSSW